VSCHKLVPIVLMTLCVGCAHLAINPSDSLPAKTGKVVARTVLFLGTGGTSELFISVAAFKARKAADTSDARVGDGLLLANFMDRLRLHARTKTDLVTVIGTLPDRCEKLSPTQEGCEWKVGKDRSEQYEGPAVAESIGGEEWMIPFGTPQTVQVSHAIRVVCVLPLDGSPRDPDSCKGSVQ